MRGQTRTVATLIALCLVFATSALGSIAQAPLEATPKGARIDGHVFISPSVPLIAVRGHDVSQKQAAPDALVEVFPAIAGDEAVGSRLAAIRTSPLNSAPRLTVRVPGKLLSPNDADARSASSRSPFFSTPTDETGAFDLPAVPAGRYLIVAQRATADGSMLLAGAATIDVPSSGTVPAQLTIKDVQWQIGSPAFRPDATVFYMTDRARASPTVTISMAASFTQPSDVDYANDSAGVLEYGTCSVESGGQSRYRCRAISAADFPKAVERAMKAAHQPQLIVYSHGFRNSFAAATRTAAVVNKATGRVVLSYDWASKDSIPAYFGDEDRLSGSLTNYGRVSMQRLTNRFSAENMVFLGHSLGARATYDFAKNVVDQAVVSGKPATIGGVVFFAGDLYASVFTVGAPELTKHSGFVLSYACQHDIPLLLSLVFHFGNRRIGEAWPAMTLVDGVMTVDATAAKSDFLAHGYVNDPALLDDLKLALDRSPIVNRKHLKKAGNAYVFGP